VTVSGRPAVWSDEAAGEPKECDSRRQCWGAEWLRVVRRGYVARRSFVSVPLVALMIRAVIILVDTIAIHPRRKCNGKGNQRTKQV